VAEPTGGIQKLIPRYDKCLSSGSDVEKYYYYSFIILSGVRLSPLGTAATTGLLYQPKLIDDGDCRATGGMKIGRGNRSTQRKPAQAPLCPPQIPHDLTRARTRAAAVGTLRSSLSMHAFLYIIKLFLLVAFNVENVNLRGYK
jgi:hypothetical protein